MRTSVAPFRFIVSWSASALFLVGACSTPDDLLTDQACPCIEGWFCDLAQSPNVCVQGEARDAGTDARDAGDVDAGVRDAGAEDAGPMDSGAFDVPDAGPGAPPPPQSTRCWVQESTCDLSGDFRFEPVPDDSNFTDDNAANVAFSPDACELLFARNVDPDVRFDIFRVEREGPGGSWSPQMAIAELNTTVDEDAPSMSPDGLEFFVASNRARPLRRVHRFTREAIGDAWNSDSDIVATLDIEGSTSWEPRLAPHGLRLYVALDIDDRQRIRVLNRPELGADFGDYETLTFEGIPADHSNNRPSVTHDGRVLVGIHQSDPLDGGTRRVFYATRPNWNAEWSEAQALPVTVGSEGMRDVGISPDGCEVIARTTTGTATLLRYTR